MKHLYLVALAMCLVMVSCSKEDDDKDTTTATCTDGIQNQDETGIDCGGVCTACGTCTDGLQNQGETGVDCGGPCTACTACVTCVSSVQGSNDITYCEDDFQSQADYDNAVAAAELSGRTCQ